MRVHVAESFLTSAAGLEGRSAADVKRAAFDFLVDPSRPGLHLHRLVQAVDRGFWSFRAGRELRVIVHRSGADVVLCYAGHHDRAYAWAAHRVWNGAGSSPPLDVALPPDATASPSTVVERFAPDEPARPCDAVRPPPSSPRSERMRQRALAPLALDAPGSGAGRAAPPPLVELLRFVREARGEPERRSFCALASPAPGGAPAAAPRRYPLALVTLAVFAVATIAVLIGAGPASAARIAHGAVAQAAVVLLLVAGLRRHERRVIARMRSEVEAAAAPTRTLGAAVTALSRGERPAALDALPDALAEPRAALELLSKFLVLQPDDLRALAGARSAPG